MFAAIMFSLLIVGFLYCFQYYRRWCEKYAHIMKIPGPRNYPLIGNVWPLMFIPRSKWSKYLGGLWKKYGTLMRMWNGIHPLVTCSNAEDAEIILSSRVNIEKSTIFHDILKPWLGSGLLLSGGSKWHHRRKLLTPAFHFSILESFLPSISEHSRTFIERLKCMESEKNEWNIFPFVHEFTLDAICETVMGIKINIQNGESSEYLQSVLDMSSIFVEKAIKPWWHNPFLYSYSSLYKQELKALNILHTMSKKVIQIKKNKRWKESLNNENTEASNTNHFQQCDGTKKKVFLEILLNISENEQDLLTDEDIREEVDTFMFEGHDTITSGILSTIHFLSSHSDIQDKVAVELFSVFGNSDRDPTLQDLSKLKYLECVIKESHRLLPPVPFIFRKLSEPITLSGKYIIPKDTFVEVDIFELHRQEKYFPNPLKFNPDNFALENVRSRHPFSFVPFSAGPRNCIGQKFAFLEEKVLLSTLFRNFRIKSSQKMEDLGICLEFVLRHENGVLVNIERREW